MEIKDGFIISELILDYSKNDIEGCEDYRWEPCCIDAAEVILFYKSNFNDELSEATKIVLSNSEYMVLKVSFEVFKDKYFQWLNS